MCMLSHFISVQLFATLWTVAHQAPLSMVFSGQEYWSGLPCPPPGDLPNPGIKLASPGSLALQVDSLPLSHQGSPIKGLLFEIILSGPRSFLQVPCQNHSLQRCSRTSHPSPGPLCSLFPALDKQKVVWRKDYTCIGQAIWDKLFNPCKPLL